MILIPAIDIKNGRCVRLRQGRLTEETIFSDDPLAVAERWVQAGARRLHLIDLDGAFAGEPVNYQIIQSIASAYSKIPIQVGGGIRTSITIENYLNAGISYCILGTQAMRDPTWVAEVCREFPGKIIIGIDARDGLVAIQGWAEITALSAIDLAQKFVDAGVSSIIYTDIQRDGMLMGINLEATCALASAIQIPVIAAGGITTLDDIQRLASIARCGVIGAITGRAIYEGTLDFSAGQQLAEKLS